MKTSVFLLCAGILLLSVCAMVSAQETNGDYKCAIEEAWKLDDEEYEVNVLYINGPSFGTFFDTNIGVEYLWVHHNTSIDFYDLTNSKDFGPNDSPPLAYSIPAGSSCSQASTFRSGDTMITTHGDVPFCTCKWTPENRCPHKVQLEIPGEDPLQVALGINSVLNIDRIDTISQAAGLGVDASENPTYACEPLVNPEDVAGKLCIVDRGGCLFQTKYENCIAAGATGTIVVNRDEAVITMPVFNVAPGDVFVMVTKSDGQIIKDNIDDITITAGRSTGPSAPVSGYSEPDAMGAVNVRTGASLIDSAPFILTDDALYDFRNQIMYATTIDGNVPSEAMAVNLAAPQLGSYPSLGIFQQNADSSYWDIFYQGDKTFIAETSWVEGFVFIYDVTDNPASPILIANVTYDDSWCPGVAFDGIEIHPSGDYMYLTPGIRRPDCPNDNDYIQAIYDITDPSMPVQVGTFTNNNMDVGSSTNMVNGLKWAWGPNDIAGIPMSSSGLVFFDFSDPVNPVQITDVYDPAVNENDFTKGIYSTQYGTDDYWYTYEKDGVDGVHGIFHAIYLVCDDTDTD